MTQHIDLYTYSGGVVDGVWNEPRRLYEGQEAIDYATTGPGSYKGLPRFNGYTYLTALHDDGECAEHAVTGRVFEAKP